MDDLIRKEDAALDDHHKNMSKEQLLGPITAMKAFEIDEMALDCPELNDNLIFIKLKQRLRKFFI